MLKAAGGSGKLAKSFADVAVCLQPFAGRPLDDFKDFLVRAEEFDRTGKVPVKKAPGGGGAGGKKGPSAGEMHARVGVPAA